MINTITSILRTYASVAMVFELRPFPDLMKFRVSIVRDLFSNFLRNLPINDTTTINPSSVANVLMHQAL